MGQQCLEVTNNNLNVKNQELSETLEKLTNTQQKLVESEKMASLGVLTAGVAHEINNPLNFIHAGISGIEQFFSEVQNCDLSSEERTELQSLIHSIHVGVDRVSSIVTSLNHFSRQTVSLDQKCDIQTILDNCLQILNNQIKYNIEIDKKYLDVPPIVVGNEGKLHQLFLNIIANSIHAIANKGLISVHVEIFNGSVLIRIKDNGSGISPENLKRVFDPFFTTKEVGKGTGLGLSIAYGIVMDHKGSITFNSKVGEGTEAIIELPLHG